MSSVKKVNLNSFFLKLDVVEPDWKKLFEAYVNLDMIHEFITPEERAQNAKSILKKLPATREPPKKYAQIYEKPPKALFYNFVRGMYFEYGIGMIRPDPVRACDIYTAGFEDNQDPLCAFKLARMYSHRTIPLIQKKIVNSLNKEKAIFYLLMAALQVDIVYPGNTFNIRPQIEKVIINYQEGLTLSDILITKYGQTYFSPEWTKVYMMLFDFQFCHHQQVQEKYAMLLGQLDTMIRTTQDHQAYLKLFELLLFHHPSVSDKLLKNIITTSEAASNLCISAALNYLFKQMIAVKMCHKDHLVFQNVRSIFFEIMRFLQFFRNTDSTRELFPLIFQINEFLYLKRTLLLRNTLHSSSALRARAYMYLKGQGVNIDVQVALDTILEELSFPKENENLYAYANYLAAKLKMKLPQFNEQQVQEHFLKSFNQFSARLSVQGGPGQITDIVYLYYLGRIAKIWRQNQLESTNRFQQGLQLYVLERQKYKNSMTLQFEIICIKIEKKLRCPGKASLYIGNGSSQPISFQPLQPIYNSTQLLQNSTIQIQSSSAFPQLAQSQFNQQYQQQQQSQYFQNSASQGTGISQHSMIKQNQFNSKISNNNINYEQQSQSQSYLQGNQQLQQYSPNLSNQNNNSSNPVINNKQAYNNYHQSTAPLAGVNNNSIYTDTNYNNNNQRDSAIRGGGNSNNNNNNPQNSSVLSNNSHTNPRAIFGASSIQPSRSQVMQQQQQQGSQQSQQQQQQQNQPSSPFLSQRNQLPENEQHQQQQQQQAVSQLGGVNSQPTTGVANIGQSRHASVDIPKNNNNNSQPFRPISSQVNTNNSNNILQSNQHISDNNILSNNNINKPADQQQQQQLVPDIINNRSLNQQPPSAQEIIPIEFSAGNSPKDNTIKDNKSYDQGSVHQQQQMQQITTPPMANRQGLLQDKSINDLSLDQTANNNLGGISKFNNNSNQPSNNNLPKGNNNIQSNLNSSNLSQPNDISSSPSPGQLPFSSSSQKNQQHPQQQQQQHHSYSRQSNDSSSIPQSSNRLLKNAQFPVEHRLMDRLQEVMKTRPCIDAQNIIVLDFLHRNSNYITSSGVIIPNNGVILGQQQMVSLDRLSKLRSYKKHMNAQSDEDQLILTGEPIVIKHFTVNSPAQIDEIFNYVKAQEVKLDAILVKQKGDQNSNNSNVLNAQSPGQQPPSHQQKYIIPLRGFAFQAVTAESVSVYLLYPAQAYNLYGAVRRFTLKQKLLAASQICDCFSQLHGNSVYHLNIKPTNVVFDGRRVPYFSGWELRPKHSLTFPQYQGQQGYLNGQQLLIHEEDLVTQEGPEEKLDIANGYAAPEIVIAAKKQQEQAVIAVNAARQLPQSQQQQGNSENTNKPNTFFQQSSQVIQQLPGSNTVSPQLLDPFGPKSDIWSIGMVLQLLFFHVDASIESFVRDKRVYEGFNLIITDYITGTNYFLDKAKEAIESMVKYLPEQRCSLASVKDLFQRLYIEFDEQVKRNDGAIVSRNDSSLNQKLNSILNNTNVSTGVAGNSTNNQVGNNGYNSASYYGNTSYQNNNNNNFSNNMNNISSSQYGFMNNNNTPGRMNNNNLSVSGISTMINNTSGQYNNANMNLYNNYSNVNNLNNNQMNYNNMDTSIYNGNNLYTSNVHNNYNNNYNNSLNLSSNGYFVGNQRKGQQLYSPEFPVSNNTLNNNNNLQAQLNSYNTNNYSQISNSRNASPFGR